MKERYTVLKATSLWCDTGTSDKVYNVQLVYDNTNGRYFVDAQWGKRLNVIKGKFQDRQEKVSNGTKYGAESVYMELLRYKSKKYNKELPEPIIPAEYTNGVEIASISKEELAKLYKGVEEATDIKNTSESVTSLSIEDMLNDI
jgi:hypothetical protein